MSSKTKEAIAQSLINYLQTYRPDIDVSSGNVVKDVVIDPVATILELSYDDLELIRKSYSINYASDMEDDQLNDLAANWNLARKDATKATGSVTFYKLTKPTTSIRIGAEDGSGGITVSTQRNSDGSYYSFITTTTVYLNTATQLNTETNRYEANVSIEASLAGIGSNVAINAITVLSGITGVDGVTNKSVLTSGTDEETNTLLSQRIITASQGRLLGTAPGYASFVEAITGVVDAVVLTSGEDNCIRNAYGNEVDVIIIGQTLENDIQAEVFSNINGLTVFFDNLPLNEVIQIVGTTNTYIEDTHFSVVKDTYSEYRRSNQALDKIVWISGAPSVGEPYNISYSYNSLIGEIQDDLDTDTNKLIASNILVREGEKTYVDISFSVTLYSGIDSTSAENQIKSTLMSYINTLYLGKRLEQSDLVYYLRQQHSFIDNIILPFTKLCRRSVGTGVADLSFSKLEYAWTDADSFVITVT